MQRFIKTLAYGLAAAALTVVTVNPAMAQKGGHGGSGGGGGFKGGSVQMGNSGKGSPAASFKTGGNSFKPQGQMTANKQLTQNGFKSNQAPKGFAKGEPNPSAPGGFKHPGSHNNHKMQTTHHNQHHNGKSFDFYGTPYGGKYQPYGNNWKGCYPNSGYNWGWNWGCYPTSGKYCWPTSYCYPSYGCYYPSYNTGYCFNTCYTYATPLCYTQTVYVPTVVQQVAVAPPMEEVVTTSTIAKKTTQQVLQGPVGPAGPVGPTADMSFLTGSALNQ